MQATVESWQPDLILRETAEFASYLVAERIGIPHAQVACSVASVEDSYLPLVDEPLRELGSARGVAGLAAAARLTLLPPSFDDGRESDPRPTHRFRYPARSIESSPELPRDWWPDSRAPLVYMTFGSVAASVGFFPDVYRRVLNALAGLPARVLLTLGDAGDPGLLEPLPPNVHVERWWPQNQIMPHTAAMLTRGGFGTTLLGLIAGVPMVVVPLFAADQFAHARRVQAVGAGISLDEGTAAQSRVRQAVELVLSDGAYRTAAGRVADEIAHLPDPSECVTILEGLINDGRRATTDRDS
jgi:UDP:flavonoid glycosyltransferase YjiC (YdhE family)